MRTTIYYIDLNGSNKTLYARNLQQMSEVRQTLQHCLTHQLPFLYTETDITSEGVVYCIKGYLDHHFKYFVEVFKDDTRPITVHAPSLFIFGQQSHFKHRGANTSNVHR